MLRTIKNNILPPVGILVMCFSSCNTGENKTNVSEIQNQQDSVLPPESYKGKAYDEIGFELLKTECLGDIKIDMTAQKTIELLGEPDKRSTPIIWEADGEYHQTWNYKGITLDLIGEENKDQVISMITITGPCSLKTKRRIGIGSDMAEVKQAYPKAIDPSFSDSLSITAGTSYGGLIFNFEDQKVNRIFFGAAAE